MRVRMQTLQGTACSHHSAAMIADDLVAVEAHVGRQGRGEVKLGSGTTKYGAE